MAAVLTKNAIEALVVRASREKVQLEFCDEPACACGQASGRQSGCW